MKWMLLLDRVSPGEVYCPTIYDALGEEVPAGMWARIHAL